MLIARDALAAAGGVRPLPLMEDVDLVRRLGRGRLTALTADAVTSAARWERDGWRRRSARNLMCLALWSAGVPTGIPGGSTNEVVPRQARIVVRYRCLLLNVMAHEPKKIHKGENVWKFWCRAR